jgi:hypothetical protein
MANGVALSLFAFADQIDNPRNAFCQFAFCPLFRLEASFPSQRLGALLGFAYRHISVEFTPKARKPSQPKPLPASVKTMADWIRVKLHQNKMAPYHLAFKMGIASVTVNAWKEGLARPDARQVRQMVTILGKYSLAARRG